MATNNHKGQAFVDAIKNEVELSVRLWIVSKLNACAEFLNVQFYEFDIKSSGNELDECRAFEGSEPVWTFLAGLYLLLHVLVSRKTFLCPGGNTPNFDNVCGGALLRR